MDSCRKRIEEVFVSGKGENKASAVADALSRVSKVLMKEATDVFLRIEPCAVSVVSAKELVSVERFLFFFFPRKKTVYQVDLCVKTQVSYLDVNEMNFVEMKDEHLDGIAIPFVQKRI